MSIAERKEREKEQRRNDIINAAEKLFFSRGYDNVSMDDIAKDVELNKATLYLYFKNKEALFFAIVLRGVRILNGMVKGNAAKVRTGSGKLWEIGHAYFSFVKRYPDYNRVYNYFYSGRFDLVSLINLGDIGSYPMDMIKFTALPWANTVNKEVVQEIIGLNREIFSITTDAVKAGIDEGAFRDDLDPAEAAVVFTLLLESIPNMRPDLKQVMDSRGIDQLNFSRDLGDYVNHMFMNKGGVGKSRR
ncbi:MAG TPA: TetR/AcrR family transcriptional regulator [Methanocella sp.]|nr:TetR/AcrR family transcriptional regulator [Methanocella sp.]